jgi:hypothetical protein
VLKQVFIFSASGIEDILIFQNKFNFDFQIELWSRYFGLFWLGDCFGYSKNVG